MRASATPWAGRRTEPKGQTARWNRWTMHRVDGVHRGGWLCCPVAPLCFLFFFFCERVPLETQPAKKGRPFFFEPMATLRRGWGSGLPGLHAGGGPHLGDRLGALGPEAAEEVGRRVRRVRRLESRFGGVELRLRRREAATGGRFCEQDRLHRQTRGIQTYRGLLGWSAFVSAVEYAVGDECIRLCDA